MAKGAANKTGVVAACGEHALCWAVGRCAYCSTDEVHLSGSNHVADTRYVVEHAPRVLVLDAFFFNLEHQHTQDLTNVAMEKHFKFVQKRVP